MAGAGLTGVTLYFLLENIALSYTNVSNVGVISSIAPFFTVLFCSIFLKSEKLHKSYFVGFLIALVGIILINFQPETGLKFNSIGDLLAIIATACWGVYSVFIKKVGALGHSIILSTRRMFTYGILFMLPATQILEFNPKLEHFMIPEVILNLLFLGIGASAMCFVSWNYAVKVIGAIRTSIYIYLVPVIAVLSSVLILHERLTFQLVCGMALTIAGLVFSERANR